MDVPTLHHASQALDNVDIRLAASDDADGFHVVLSHAEGGPHFRSGAYSRAEAEAIVDFLGDFSERGRWTDDQLRALRDASD